MNTIKLCPKRCPVCKGIPVVIRFNPDEYQVECDEPLCPGPDFEDERIPIALCVTTANAKDAIEKWNSAIDFLAPNDEAAP